ncbi:MAG: hypothetical protein GY922_16895 [Proteobacteria bacterium]|nr:hypothetical protein [Pseudomonadota bacterium]
MTTTIQCQCGKCYKLNASYAGKNIQCSGCSQILRVPGGRSPASPSQNGGPKLQSLQPAIPAATKKVSHNKAGWQSGVNSLLAAVGFEVPEGLSAVNRGAKIVIYAYIIAAGLPLLLYGIGFILPASALLLFYVLPFAYVIAISLGFYCCLQVPAKSNARPIIMIACCCLLLGALGGLGLKSVASLLTTASFFIYLPLEISGTALFSASFILFLLFIRKVASWLKQGNIVQEAMLNIYILAALTGVTLLLQGALTYQAYQALNVAGSFALGGDVTQLAQQGTSFATGFTALYAVMAVLAAVGIGLFLFLIIRLVHLVELINFRQPVAKNRAARAYHPGLSKR